MLGSYKTYTLMIKYMGTRDSNFQVFNVVTSHIMLEIFKSFLITLMEPGCVDSLYYYGKIF